MKRAQRRTPWPREGLATIQEAADFLSVSRSTVYQAIKLGRLQTITIATDQRLAWPDLHRLARSAKQQ